MIRGASSNSEPILSAGLDQPQESQAPRVQNPRVRHPASGAQAGPLCWSGRHHYHWRWERASGSPGKMGQEGRGGEE